MSGIIRDIEPWFMKGLEVRASRIHGDGLHTQKDIKRDAVILRMGGCFFLLSDRCTSSVMPSTITPISDQVILAESVMGDKDYSDYINHSCNPNIGFLDALTIVAIDDICIGEELVIDYAFWESDEQWILKYICNCGSPQCRRNVTGLDWKSFTSSDKKYLYFSPFLRRRILTLGERGVTNDRE